MLFISNHDFLKIYLNNFSGTIIDLRDETDYQDHHLLHSINIPFSSFLLSKQNVFSLKKPYYIIDYSYHRVKDVASFFTGNYPNIYFVYGGINYLPAPFVTQ